MKYVVSTCCLILFCFANNVFAQNDSTNISNSKYKAPYTIKFKVDAPIIAGTVGLHLLGYKLIDEKKDLTPEELAKKTVDKIPFFDRGNAGRFSRKWDDASYPLFKGSLVLPVALALIDKKQRSNFLKIATLYVETMGIVGSIYTLSAGLVDRSRPWVYGENTPYRVRVSATNQRSFMAGHTASTTGSLIFIAKVFSDLHPDSKLKPYIWTTAIATSAFMGYMRYKTGAHFLSDNLAGFVTGFAVAYFIPEWHKNKKLNEKISILPYAGPSSGIAVVYKL